jgi:type I restriction enzyme S subunit
MNRMQAWSGMFAVSSLDGVISPDYSIFRPTSEAVADYFAYLFKTPPLVERFAQLSKGIGSGFNRLYTPEFGSVRVAVPPRDEQYAIVRFLDQADRRIRRAIRAKQKLIAVLNEQKRAVIHHAVRRGLDPTVRLKPSGVDWLGPVPEHWRIARLKSELRNLNAGRIPLSSTERGRMSSRRYDYYGASGVIDKVDEYLFDDELLLIAEDGANLVLRNLPLVVIARGKFWVNNHAHILKPRRGSLDYFAGLLETIDFKPWITGAAQPKLTQERLMAIRVPVPPEAEQTEIAAWIKSHTRDGDTGIARARQEIELLREYRTRMVADVVTGELDVREAAVRLPDEFDEAGSLDETAIEQIAEDDAEDLEPVEA